MWNWFKKIISLLLVLILLEQSTSHIAAQENLKNRYISEVSVGSVKELEAAGFQVLENNLNEGGTPVYIGYKYTDNPDEAITDVSALSMYGGYSPLSYKDVLLNDSQGVIDLGNQLKTAAAEFRSNYYAGNPYAEIAYDTLNAMTVPDGNDETLLGDYLISGQRTLADFKKLGLMCSNVVMSFILNQLSLGVADNTTAGKTSWLDRLSDNGPMVFTDEDGEALDEGSVDEIYQTKYDSLYMQRARKLYVSIADFTENYTEAVQRSGSLEDMTAPSTASAEASVDAISESMTQGETLEYDEAAEAADEDSDNCGDMLPLALYALLDEKDSTGAPIYPYGTKDDGTSRTLAEFFIEVGSMEDGEDAYRALYPLIVSQNGVTPLTSGQEIAMYLAGFTGMISIGCSDEQAIEQSRTASAEKAAEFKQINGSNPVSVWYDVNTDIYDETQSGVYWTSDMIREAAAHNRYDLLTKPTGVIDVDTQGKLNNAMLYLACVGVGALGAAMVASKVIGAAFAIKGMTLMVTCAVKFMASAALTYSTAACVACVIGTVFLAVLAVVVLAIIVIALIKLFIWLFEDDDPDLELTEIPKTIYDYNDSGEGSAVIYRVVSSPGTETPANLNAGLSNTPWVALYYSKDKTLGEPLTAEFDGENLVTNAFTVQKGSQNTPENYNALKFFGSVTSANLNEGRSGVKGIFCFFHRLDGAISDDSQQGQYISEVKLTSASGSNCEEAAKTELIDSGYAVVDYNLTSDGSIASYIGYKTTDDESKAITDLRVAYSTGMDENSAVINYGGAQYGCCGSAGNLLLMQSKWACVGTPILASDLIVTDTLGDAPEGYEPVNLFCGGPAFDFNTCDNWAITSEEDGKEDSSKWASSTYIYFNPSVKFTSGTAYLGGLAFFSGTVDKYIAYSGWTKLTNENLKNSASDIGITYDLSGLQDGNTVLCYSTTYNPYRAIYDIQYYGAEASAQGLPYNISLYSGGAVACDIFQQSGGGVGNNRMLRVTHAYRSCNWYEGGGYYDYSGFIDSVGEFQKFSRDEANYTEWYEVNGEPVPCNIKCVGLFAVGSSLTSVETANPIRISELEVSASDIYDAETTTPIRSITDCYADTGANLAFNDLYYSGNFYLYLHRTDEHAKRPTYIESVTVATVTGYDADNDNGSSAPYDSAVYSLVGKGAGTLLAIDLTGNRGGQERTTTYAHEYLAGIGNTEYEARQNVTCISHETNYEVSLVWVTYTNTRTKGLSDIVIYESSDGTVPMEVKASDGATTVACGDGFRTNKNGNYYFLRGVYNAGNPITDIKIDSTVMLRNYWTSISTDGTASNYNKFYIKARHFRKATLTYYISGIYTATGVNETEALKSLLNQGCRYCCPFNLSPDGNAPLYVGYSLSTSYKNAYSGLILYDAGQDNTVDTIIKGRDTYTRVTDSLNSGVYDSIISMYLTKSVRKACETGGTKASNGHYITDITFYTDTDLNDYATGEKSLDGLDAKTRAYVEDYIYGENGEPVYWDIVTDSTGSIVNCNITAVKGGTLSETAPQVYMYIHYSDNKTPYLTSLSGSLFTNHPTIAVTLCAGGSLLLAAAVYLVLKKKKTVSETVSVQKEEAAQ